MKREGKAAQKRTREAGDELVGLSVDKRRRQRKAARLSARCGEPKAGFRVGRQSAADLDILRMALDTHGRMNDHDVRLLQNDLHGFDPA